MATNTYVALNTTTLTSSAASVTLSLSGITGYTDIRVVFSSAAMTIAGTLTCYVNGDTGTNYSYTDLSGNGSSATSARGSSTDFMLIGGQTVGFSKGVATADFMNYSNTTTFKTMLSRTSDGSRFTEANVSLWRSTAAINSITITTYAGGGTFNAGSTFTVYGIANADNFTKATGGMITEDATYVYHTFGASGTFTPKQSLTADVLVVAGGGGTNGQAAGGGGAGGLLVQTGRSLTATGYTVTVGAGGPLGDAGQASSGSNSVFDTSTALGGGRGGYANITVNGANGGSGGGASYNGTAGGTSTQSNSGGATGYGFSGATGGNNNGAGGGGGAGGAGAVGNSSVGGAGGIGRTDSLINAIGAATGMGQLVSGNYYFAGGGGGGVVSGTVGAGGAGGGGTGGNYNTGTPNGAAGLANTGGGAGGRGTAGAGFPGGSGVVIIRYPK
jgi:hypothetical protein